MLYTDGTANIDEYRWETMIHPNSGAKLTFQVPMYNCKKWFFLEETKRYMIYVHYQLDKELLWRFQEANPDKILLPGLQPMGEYFVANYLPKSWDECVGNVNEFAKAFYFKNLLQYNLRQFKVEKTVSDAKAFLQFTRDYTDDFDFDFYVIENFRGDNDGNVFWFDPIV